MRASLLAIVQMREHSYGWIEQAATMASMNVPAQTQRSTSSKPSSQLFILRTIESLLLATILLACSIEAQAAHPKLKHVAELVYNFGLPAGTSLLATHEIHKCRQEFGIGPCPNGGYGEFRTRMALNFGISVGLGTLSHFWHKESSDKAAFIPSTGIIAWNTVTAIQAATHKGPHAD